MTRLLVELIAAVWILWVTTVLTGHTMALRILVKVVPTALAFLLLFFTTAQFMRWPV